nr:putative ribonuclease H-like domain-containing protein [Tanacetum cinerariifolium]
MIDYDKVFAPVARIEAIRLFLAYASFKDFMVYQMDVKSAFLYVKIEEKSAFLYRTIEEEVYVCQPPGFEDPNHPDKVYKVVKSKPVSITAVRPVSADVPKIKVTRPRHAYSINTKSKSPIRRHITRSPSPKTSNSPPRVTAAQAPVVSAAKGVETPLFEGMLVVGEPQEQGDADEQVQGNDNDAAQEADTAVSGDDVQDQSIPSPTLPTPPPQPPQDIPSTSQVLSMQEDEPKVQEVVEVVTTTKLITEVVVAVSESVSAASATIAAVPAATVTAVPVAEEGDADENVEEINAGDAAEGNVSAAHGEVATIVEEPSIPSPTPPTPPAQPYHDIPSTSQVQPTPPQSPQEGVSIDFGATMSTSQHGLQHGL